MKIFIAILWLTVLFGATCLGQDEKASKLVLKGEEFKIEFEFEKECGSPLMESQLYDQRVGKIVAVNSANEVVFKQDSVNGNRSKGTFTVKLAGISGSTNEAAIKNLLVAKLLGQNAEVVGNTESEGDRSLSAIVSGGELHVVNRYLLENGLAEYSKFWFGNRVPDYDLCVYRQVTEKAKKAKLGIWAK